MLYPIFLSENFAGIISFQSVIYLLPPDRSLISEVFFMICFYAVKIEFRMAGEFFTLNHRISFFATILYLLDRKLHFSLVFAGKQLLRGYNRFCQNSFSYFKTVE